jgi:hypothetical protein
MLLLAVVLSLAWLLWFTWPRPTPSPAPDPTSGPGPGQDPVEVAVGVAGRPVRVLRWDWPVEPGSAPRRARFPGRPPLTEDDLIAFGLALELSDDGVAELLDGQPG